MSQSSQETRPDTLLHMKSTNSTKGVTIHDEPQEIEANDGYTDGNAWNISGQTPRVHRASISGRKLTGRSAMSTNASSTSLSKDIMSMKLDSTSTDQLVVSESSDQHGLLHQVMQWIADERAKRARKHLKPSDVLHDRNGGVGGAAGSSDGEPDLALDKLEKIVAKYAAHAVSGAVKTARGHTSPSLRRESIAKKLVRTHSGAGAATSDTDGADAVARVPHVEAMLDNTKTLAFTGGQAGEEDDNETKSKEQKNWESFKYEILRLTHTLKLKGWRRLSYEDAALMHVERLSGALTNAVYVVRAPKDIDLYAEKDEAGNLIKAKRLPRDLLLRIYGPQVEHLIDREAELLILRRLAAKNIGPKLLGYFSNGRFEEFLNAKTLTCEDLRNPDISKLIAKRMKELHEGIDLLEKERDGGPFVFVNWDNWVKRVEKVITWLDAQVHKEERGEAPASSRYTRRGLVCGADWKVFKNAYDKYRTMLVGECGGQIKLRESLIFAHNDTQYGNLMRLQPPEESPLLHAVNQHKQLVVIDFEYANANMPGLEFANHFTEWCYNYHDEEKSYACDSKVYPTPEEQRRFVKAYVMHRPQFAASASSTPMFQGREKTNVPDFMLDSRGQNAMKSDFEEEEKIRESSQEDEISHLLHQTRLWRVANHALWVAWGIVQAKVPELDEAPKKHLGTAIKDKIMEKFHPHTDPLDADIKEKQEDMRHDRPEGREQEEAHNEGEANEEEVFDYLAYSQERAMFFWGDCVQMGIIKEEDLPEKTRAQIKYVKY